MRWTGVTLLRWTRPDEINQRHRAKDIPTSSHCGETEREPVWAGEASGGPRAAARLVARRPASLRHLVLTGSIARATGS